ncbi:MAG TPA: hypothetical protein VGE24_08060, partial [Emticicia sp.]
MANSNSSQYNSGWLIQAAGENNTITLNLLHIKDFRDKVEQREKLENILKAANEEIKLALSETINKLRDEIELFKQNVLETARILSNIKIDTERLEKAKAAFDKGLIQLANELLNEKDLKEEQNQLLHSVKEKQKELVDLEEKLRNNSNEYLFKAQLTILDFAIENRLDKAKEFFQ